MKIFYVGLIGYGKMGKIYEKEIKKIKGFKIVEILKHKNLKENPDIIKKFFNSKKINLFIISSPLNTHFKYLNLAYESKKNIIIEKPLVEKLSQLKKLLEIHKKFKKKIMIHHNDVLNLEELKLLKKNNTKDLKKIEMFYGCRNINNSYKKPFFDWLPHPLSVIVNFFDGPINFEILEYSSTIKKKLFFEKIKILIKVNNLPIYIDFSNNLKKPIKKIILYTKNKKNIYDGYKAKNKKTVKLLLEKFYNTQVINFIKPNFKVYNLLFKIEKKIEYFHNN